jgi:hypothetical protein
VEVLIVGMLTELSPESGRICKATIVFLYDSSFFKDVLYS